MTDLIPISPVIDIVPSVIHLQDRVVVREWLRSKRSKHTRKAYTRDIESFFTFLLDNDRSPCMAGVTLTDIQDYADHLRELHPEPATQSRMLASVKSLFTFAHKTGFISFNIGSAQQLPEGKDKLSERILTPAQVNNMVYEARRNPAHHIMLLLLYATGIRCAELCGLQWRDVQETGTGAQITVLGKRNKTRSIVLPDSVWVELKAYRPANATSDDYVFQSRKTTIRGGTPSRKLSEVQVWRIVTRYAKEAGISDASTHWFRHAHATRAMEKGAPLRLIQETLGHADLRTPSKYQHVRPGTSSSQYLDL